MQALCQWDVQHDESSENLREFLDAHAEVAGNIAYAAELVETYWARRDRIDRRIADAATQWDLARISRVERNAMRVAVVEMMSERIPPKVALHEAMQIGDQFGGADSSRFINGVLDKIKDRFATPPPALPREVEEETQEVDA